jgi:para-aminobenzoate synthetase component I
MLPDIDANELVARLVDLSVDVPVCILDSCGVGTLGSNLLIAGVDPVDVMELRNDEANVTLDRLESLLRPDAAAIFTLSYDLGRKLLKVGQSRADREPEAYLALFDVLIIHDHDSGKTRLAGNAQKFASVGKRLRKPSTPGPGHVDGPNVDSNFTRADYLTAIENIQELIRAGDTYQTNLTQRLTAELPPGMTPEWIFKRLRRDHPAPFASFLKRKTSTVVSASPERFFRVRDRQISTSPIKGTRPRGLTPDEDATLREDLLTSEKDRAENTMIVDLLRNDIGRVCEFGSVRVERLCELETHPTFFNLVSTVTGELRLNTNFSDILRAVFPCGSITGAPKVSTMKIIDEIEPDGRGLSMGAIGYYAPPEFGLPATFDLSVAIRTMVVRGRMATFNVGGGITIDSDPEMEYEESLVKAKALLNAINGTMSQ